MTHFFDDGTWRSMQWAADILAHNAAALETANEVAAHNAAALEAANEIATRNAAALQHAVQQTVDVWTQPVASINDAMSADLASLEEMMETVEAAHRALNNYSYFKLGDYLKQIRLLLTEEPDVHEVIEHPELDLALPEQRERIIIYSPSISLIEKLRRSQLSIHDLEWRQLEELVADLLSQDGYEVTLGPGSKDEGKDIIAVKYVPGAGFFMTVWQAKKLKQGNRVGIRVIRELADTRQEHKASKGVIVTTTSLTRGALARIERDRYLLHKVDGNDLDAWIQTGRQP